MDGAGEKLLIFTALVLQLLGGGLLLSNERKNQTKVDQLIHPIRTKIYYSIYLE